MRQLDAGLLRGINQSGESLTKIDVLMMRFGCDSSDNVNPANFSDHSLFDVMCVVVDTHHYPLGWRATTIDIIQLI